jgi:transcriptional regulator with XRE-family HTH domain
MRQADRERGIPCRGGDAAARVQRRAGWTHTLRYQPYCRLLVLFSVSMATILSVEELSMTTTDDWERLLGDQIRAARLAAGLPQVNLAAQANVALGALKNLESGKGSTVRTLVRVVRALGRSDWLEALAPPVTISPLAAFEQSQRNSSVRARRRVSRRQARPG